MTSSFSTVPPNFQYFLFGQCQEPQQGVGFCSTTALQGEQGWGVLGQHFALGQYILATLQAKKKKKRPMFSKTWGTRLINYPFIMFLHFSWNNDPGTFSFTLCLPDQVTTYFVVQISRALWILQCVISVGLSVMSCIIQPPISVVGNNIFI